MGDQVTQTKPFQGRFSGMRMQLILVYMLIVAVAMGAMNLFFTRVLEQHQLGQHVRERQQIADSLAVMAAGKVSLMDTDDLYDFAVENGRNYGGRVLVLDAAGVVLADGHSELNGRQIAHREVVEVLSGVKDRAYGFHKHIVNTDDGKESTEWVGYYTAVVTYQTQRLGAVLLSIPVQSIVDSINEIRMQVWGMTLAVILFVIAISVMLAGHFVRPITDMTRAALQMSAGRFDTRVKVKKRSRNEVARLAEAFNRLSERLEIVEQSRNEFISNVSHELKTPLSSMKILIEALILQESDDIALQKEFLRDVNQEIDRLSAIISDLLALMQMEQKNIAQNKQPAALDEIVNRVIQSLLPMAEKSDITIEEDVESGVIVQGDAARLHQVVLNLLDNAIKYTPAGGRVIVDLFHDENTAVLAIRDTGIGIPEKELPRIFERFYRVDRARSRASGGTGLGLSIAQQIVKAHKGIIQVQSVEGEGTEFTVRLPLMK